MNTRTSSDGPSGAWDDDDWETQADKPATDLVPPPEKKVSSKVTKAQRRAQQAEFNRKLWAEAEQPETFHYLEAKSNIPLKHGFKPTVTLLSRKPQAVLGSLRSAEFGSTAAPIGQFGRDPGDEFDDAEEGSDAPKLSPEEWQAMALRNREEKQRKYEEARERLFGSPSAPVSSPSSPRSSTPPKEGRGKGKSRGGNRGNRNGRDSSMALGSSKQLHDLGQCPSPGLTYVPGEERPSAGERQQIQQNFRNAKDEGHGLRSLRAGPGAANSR